MLTINIGAGCTDPVVVGNWKSWKNHTPGYATALDLFIDCDPSQTLIQTTPNPSICIETRAGSIQWLTVDFDQAIALPLTSDIVLCGTKGGPYYPDSVSVNGNTLTMNFSGIPDGQAGGQADLYRVTLNNITDATGGCALAGDNDCDIAAQFGNVTRNLKKTLLATDGADRGGITTNFTPVGSFINQAGGQAQFDIWDTPKKTQGRVDGTDEAQIDVYKTLAGEGIPDTYTPAPSCP
jgi:hypothetical protein